MERDLKNRLLVIIIKGVVAYCKGCFIVIKKLGDGTQSEKGGMPGRSYGKIRLTD
jgi:hypothetical protein